MTRPRLHAGPERTGRRPAPRAGLAGALEQAADVTLVGIGGKAVMTPRPAVRGEASQFVGQRVSGRGDHRQGPAVVRRRRGRGARPGRRRRTESRDLTPGGNGSSSSAVRPLPARASSSSAWATSATVALAKAVGSIGGAMSSERASPPPVDPPRWSSGADRSRGGCDPSRPNTVVPPGQPRAVESLECRNGSVGTRNRFGDSPRPIYVVPVIDHRRRRFGQEGLFARARQKARLSVEVKRSSEPPGDRGVDVTAPPGRMPPPRHRATRSRTALQHRSRPPAPR